MSDIDGDVMAKARDLAQRASIHHSDADRIHILARAIQAERERCARIAERSTPYRILPSGDGATYIQFPGKGTMIAAAIRTPDRDDGE